MISSASRRGERVPPELAFGVGKFLQVIDQPRQRDPVAAIGGQVIAAHLRHAAVAPLEKTARLVDRVDHVGHLERLGEEILVDEQVVVRQEDPETGMGVIPAHDVEIGIPPVALAGDLFPRVVGVGEAGLGVGVVLGLERLGDPDERLAGRLVEAFLAQQDAPQLDRRVGQGVPLDRVGGAAIEEDRQVGRARDLVGQAGEPPVAVGPLPPLRLADLHLAEDDLVAAQRLDPQPVLRSPRSAARRKKPDSAGPSTRTIS